MKKIKNWRKEKVFQIAAGIVSPQCLKILHPWIQPTTITNTKKKEKSKKLTLKQYSMTTIYKAFTLC